jgi:hypothetical protein
LNAIDQKKGSLSSLSIPDAENQHDLERKAPPSYAHTSLFVHPPQPRNPKDRKKKEQKNKMMPVRCWQIDAL